MRDTGRKQSVEWSRDLFRVSCDPNCLDRDFIASFLADTYWAKGIPQSTVEKSLDGSICFLLLDSRRQIGFARVISDHATIAYLNDVFVIPEYRGIGLGTWLVECALAHPELKGLLTLVFAEGTLCAQNVIRIDAPGNLEAKAPLTCVRLSDITSSSTPAEIFPGAADCLRTGKPDLAIRMLMLAGVYGRFDSLRVADKSAHQAMPREGDGIVEGFVPAAAWEDALDKYLHRPRS